MLYILYLEPLEERYTRQWYRWFDEELTNQGIPHVFISGKQLTTEVETGVVLDAEGTNYWKFSQLMAVCELFKIKRVKDGDVFFTMDLWHPGLEAIPYMATLEGIKVGLYGFLHAGSYTTEDFASPMAEWAQFHEVGWAVQCDGVFVGTEYHAQKFYSERTSLTVETWKADADALLHVTGNPFKTSEIRDMAEVILPVSQRENVIIYPNRFDQEKRPGVFLDMMDRLYEERQDFEVWFTTSRRGFRSNSPELLKRLNAATFPHQIKSGLSKTEYYRLMAQAKIFVSTTIEENFGYCLAEAIALDCVPVVPDAYSHPELLCDKMGEDYRPEIRDRNYLYLCFDHALALINRYLDAPVAPPLYYAEKYDDSIKRMLSIIDRDYPLKPVQNATESPVAAD